MSKKLRLGDLLMEAGVISEEQLQAALGQQKKTGMKLGQALVATGALSEKALLELLSQQLKLPIFDLGNYEAQPEVTKLLSEAYARRFRALVLEDHGDTLFVGMSDPLDLVALDELERVLPKPLELALLREEDLLQTLDLVYRRTEDISAFAQELSDEVDTDENLANLAEDFGRSDAPVIKLLQSLFEDAVQIGASDIHIEPGEKTLRIRLRVDGVLQEQVMDNKAICRAIIVRLKLMSNLNIAENRLPQDGRFNIKVREKIIDIRLSILPIQYGESAVMRLLDQTQGNLNLDTTGMPPEILARFRKLLCQPHGLILVTGPTGSGKSTTLYGGLNELNEPEKKIITVEDPVEYRLERVNQVQINTKIGMTFAGVLRTTLRQDPDIIMVGEMRDHETAQIAIRAALTGHMVLSTLHTNDSASSAFRLVDMDIQGFLVAATLRGVLAQRLVRRICKRCVAPMDLEEAQKNWLLSVMGPEVNLADFKAGKGCNYCNKTGYRGRMGVYELLELDAPMMSALRQNNAATFADVAQEALKGRLLFDNAMQLAQQGLTTISEVIRVAGEF